MCLQQRLEARLTGDSFGSYKSKTLPWKCLKCLKTDTTYISQPPFLHCRNRIFSVLRLLRFFMCTAKARLSVNSLSCDCSCRNICSFLSVSGRLHTDWWQCPIFRTNPAGPQVSEWPRDTCGCSQHPGSWSGSQSEQKQQWLKLSHTQCSQIWSAYKYSGSNESSSVYSACAYYCANIFWRIVYCHGLNAVTAPELFSEMSGLH